MALVLDTSALLAALDSADPDHEPCASLLTEASEGLVVPALALAELDYWCHERLTADVWAAFLDDVLNGAYEVEAPTHLDLVRCRELQRTYRDLGVGVVDASVLALLERLGEPKLATLESPLLDHAPGACRRAGVVAGLSFSRATRSRPEEGAAPPSRHRTPDRA